MKKLLIVISSVGLLSGCASTSVASKEDSKAKKIEPTYFEKVSGATPQEIRTSFVCPKHEKDFAAGNWRQLSNMAAACVRNQDWSRVEQLGNAIAIKGSKTPWGPYYMGLAAEFKKNFPRAQWMLELALKKAPNEGILHYELGRIHWLMGNDILALKSLKQASDFNPSLTEAHWITGMVALNSDKLGDADAAFQKALSTDRQHWPTVMALAELKIRQKDWIKAASQLHRAIDLNPRSTRARVALAALQETQLKAVSDALDTYKDIKRLSAGNKLDAPLNFNVEDKIRNIEGLIKQSLKPQVSKRQPSNDGKVAK